MRTENPKYMLVFSDKQIGFIANPENAFAIMALYYLVTNAKVTSEMVKHGMIKFEVSQGKCAIPEAELRQQLGCGQKALRNILQQLNEYGFIQTKYGHPVCTHSILCLKAWTNDDVIVVNPEAK